MTIRVFLLLAASCFAGPVLEFPAEIKVRVQPRDEYYAISPTRSDAKSFTYIALDNMPPVPNDANPRKMVVLVKANQTGRFSFKCVATLNDEPTVARFDLVIAGDAPIPDPKPIPVPVPVPVPVDPAVKAFRDAAITDGFPKLRFADIADAFTALATVAARDGVTTGLLETELPRQLITHVGALKDKYPTVRAAIQEQVRQLDSIIPPDKPTAALTSEQRTTASAFFRNLANLLLEAAK